jgi:REP element-mobilizing transposase RayT
MTYNPDVQHRCSIRLKDYDYAQAGAYFITICTYNKESIFGNVINGEMMSNEYGQVVEREWLKTTQIRTAMELDEFVIMPNHMHGIFVIMESPVGAHGCAPLHIQPLQTQHGCVPIQRKPRSLSSFLAGFKSAVTRQINELRGTPYAPLWQRNYYEHVIRNEDDLSEIREYIVNNPLKWDLDSENPNNVGAHSIM